METGDRAAGDGYKCKWKNLAAEDRPVPVRELGQRGHQGRRMHRDDADGERGDRSNLDECRR